MSDINHDEEEFDEFDEETLLEEDPDEKPNSSKRTLQIILGVIGAIILIAMIGLAVYAAMILPQRNAQRLQEVAEINARNTATALSVTQFAFAQREMLNANPTATPKNLELSSPTPVVLKATADPALAKSALPAINAAAQTPAPASSALDLSARTQTVSALLTQAAGGYSTAVATLGATQLPRTGFMDEVGLPSMVGLAGLLLVVIVVARRLRSSNT